MTSPDIKTILNDALDDEYKAEATYAAVIDRFGDVRPFINVIEAERRHAEAIKRQLRRFGWEVRSNRQLGKVSPPASLAKACEAAIQAEVDNIAMYDRLLPQISDAAVREVLENLQRASRENHLPAFRRCLARERSRGSCR